MFPEPIQILYRIMLKFIYALFVFGLLISGGSGFAQNESSPTSDEKPAWKQHASTSIGLNFNRSYDQRLAERSFYGLGIDLGIGDRWVRPHTWLEYEILLNQMAAVPAHGEHLLFGGFFEASYRQLHRLKNSSPWRIHLGGEAGGFFNGRLHNGLGNSNIHMEWSGYLGALAQVAREVKLPLLKGPSTVAARLHLPLFSYVGRLPSYALPGLETPAHYFRPTGGFTRIKTVLSITRPRGKNNPNLGQLAYVWDFYALNEGSNEARQRLRFATHSLRWTVWLRKGDV